VYTNAFINFNFFRSCCFFWIAVERVFTPVVWRIKLLLVHSCVFMVMCEVVGMYVLLPCAYKPFGQWQVDIKLNSVAWVRERTIPTERPPLVGQVNANFCGKRVSRGQLDGSLQQYSRLLFLFTAEMMLPMLLLNLKTFKSPHNPPITKEYIF
jgi:hypothetical protein